jgi:hypothetical protein
MEFPTSYSDQVLENVLQFLSTRWDRNAASLVCKSWCRVEALTRSELFIGNCYVESPRRATARLQPDAAGLGGPLRAPGERHGHRLPVASEGVPEAHVRLRGRFDFLVF